MPLPNINKVFQTTYSRIWRRNSFMGGSLKTTTAEIVSLTWHTYWSSPMSLPNIIKICLRVSKLRRTQDFGFRGDNYITKKKVRVVSCTWHAYRSSSSFLPNIISSAYLRPVWELWPAQDFGFRGDNYIMKKVRVVCHAHNTPTGSLHFYQTSKYA